jgi:hypothetical protein
MEKISKDIVNIIGSQRPEARIMTWLETVFLSIANNIVTIICCSRPEVWIGKGGRQARWARPITGFLLPPPTPTSLLLSSETLYISYLHRDPLQIKTACCHICHRSGAARSQLKPNLALEQGLCFKNALFYFIQSF